jgi:hypothetical protein
VEMGRGTRVTNRFLHPRSPIGGGKLAKVHRWSMK